METYSFTDVEVEDLLNNHAYEMAEIINSAYDDIYKELKGVGDFNE